MGFNYFKDNCVEHILTLFYDTSDIIPHHYCPQNLSLSDRYRLARQPNLAHCLDWKTSRALKYLSQQEYGVLSHSHTCALWACVTDKRLFGVDLQYMRMRNFTSWHKNILHQDEQQFLRQHHHTFWDYYALFTAKEALIKAIGGEWADLAQVGLRLIHNQWRWCTPNMHDWHVSLSHLDNFMMALAYSGNQINLKWQGFGQWHKKIPKPYNILYQHFTHDGLDT